MKVLMLSQGRNIADQPDYDVSFRNAQSEGQKIELLNIPFRGYVDRHNSEGLFQEVVRANDEFRPDLIFFQFFHTRGLGNPIECVRKIKDSSNKPIVFGSVGDLFDTGILSCLGVPLPRHTIQLASCTDAFFTTSMGNVSNCLVENGAKNVVFLPNAFCPMHFPCWDFDDLDDKKYGVTMLCSNARLISRHPLRTVENTIRRRKVVKQFMSHFGNDFSIFGRGWEGVSSKGAVPFKEQLKIYRESRVVVDAPAPTMKTTYYSSDRAFFMLGSGTPLVHFHTPRFEKMFRSEEHAYYVNSVEEAVRVCSQLLCLTEEELKERRKKITTFVKSRHLIDHRVDTIISTAEALRESRNGSMSPNDALGKVRMWHFLPDVDLRDEYQYAVANWLG